MKNYSCFLLVRDEGMFLFSLVEDGELFYCNCYYRGRAVFLSFSSTIFVLLQFGVFCFTHLYIHTTVFFFLFLFFISGDRLHTSPITSNSHIF